MADDERKWSFNKALDFYEEDQRPKALELCLELLEQAGGALSRTLRIRTLALALTATSDYWEAEEYRKGAEALWLHGRRMFPKRDETVAPDPLIEAGIKPEPRYATDKQETVIQRLRVLLDDVAAIQEEEKAVLDSGEYEILPVRPTAEEEAGHLQASATARAVEEEMAIQEQEASMADIGSGISPPARRAEATDEEQAWQAAGGNVGREVREDGGTGR